MPIDLSLKDRLQEICQGLDVRQDLGQSEGIRTETLDAGELDSTETKSGSPGWHSIGLHTQITLKENSLLAGLVPFCLALKITDWDAGNLDLIAVLFLYTILDKSIKSTKEVSSFQPFIHHLYAQGISPWRQHLLFCTYAVQDYSWVCPTTTTRADNTQKSCIHSHYSYTSFYFWHNILPKRNLEIVSIALPLWLQSDSYVCLCKNCYRLQNCHSYF